MKCGTAFGRRRFPIMRKLEIDPIIKMTITVLDDDAVVSGES
jgi:hypothetical protein